MKGAKTFYGDLLGVRLNEMQMGGNDYALFELKDKFNTGCLVKGEGYVPSQNRASSCTSMVEPPSRRAGPCAEARRKSLVEEDISFQGSGAHRLFYRY